MSILTRSVRMNSDPRHRQGLFGAEQHGHPCKAHGENNPFPATSIAPNEFERIAAQAALHRIADDCRGDDVGDEVATGRSDHVGKPDALFGRSGKDRLAKRAFSQVKRNGGDAKPRRTRRQAQTAPASSRSSELGEEIDLDLGRDPKQHGAGKCEADLCSQALARTGWQRKNGQAA